MTTYNVQQTFFSQTQAVDTDQPVQANALLALLTLQAVAKAADDAQAAGVNAANKMQVAAPTAIDAPTQKQIDEAYEKLLDALKKALSGNYEALMHLFDTLTPRSVFLTDKIQALLTKYDVVVKQAILAEAQWHSYDKDDKWFTDHIQKWLDIPNAESAISSFYGPNGEGLAAFIAATTAKDGITRIWRVIDDKTGAVIEYPFEKYRDLIRMLIMAGHREDTKVVKNPIAAMMDELMKEYKEHFIQKIKAAGDAGNVGMAFMILMSMFDSDYSAQEGSLARSTDMLTGLTNDIASPLLAMIMDTKDMNGQDFVRAIWLAKQIVAASPQFDSIAESLNNAIDGIMNVKSSTDNPGSTETVPMSALIDAYLSGELTPVQFDRIFHKFMANVPLPAQALVNNVQQIGALFTGLSKQVSTNLSIVANKDDAVIKMGNSAASSKESYQQMMSSFVHNQKSN